MLALETRPSMTTNLSLRKQKGNAILVVAIIVLMMMISYSTLSASRAVNKMRVARNKAQAEKIQVVADALKEYRSRYFEAIVNGESIDGVSDPLAPTIDEFQALHLLRDTEDYRLPGNVDLNMLLEVTPSGCTHPNCKVNTLVYTASPLLGQVGSGIAADFVQIGSIAQQAGKNAGYSSNESPSLLVGQNGSWSLPNPTGTAGIIGIRGGDSVGDNGYVIRQNGTLGFSNTWGVGNKSINNIDAVQASTADVNSGVNEGESCASENEIAVGATGQAYSCTGGTWKKAYKEVQVTKTVP